MFTLVEATSSAHNNRCFFTPPLPPQVALHARFAIWRAGYAMFVVLLGSIFHALWACVCSSAGKVCNVCGPARVSPMPCGRVFAVRQGKSATSVVLLGSSSMPCERVFAVRQGKSATSVVLLGSISHALWACVCSSAGKVCNVCGPARVCLPCLVGVCLQTGRERLQRLWFC